MNHLEIPEKRVFKYLLQLVDQQAVAMPEGAEILSVQHQHDDLVLWALVDPTKPAQMRDLRVVGTGNPVILEDCRFIATCQEPKRPLVWHIFEKMPPAAPVEKRPSGCRNRKRDEGQAYPKSGCQVCGTGGMTGCPYER